MMGLNGMKQKMFLILLVLISVMQIGCSTYSDTMKVYENIQKDNAKVLYDSAMIDLKIKKYDRAIESLNASADAGYAPAQFSLGVMYSDGLVLKQDNKKAFNYFKLAAKQGNLVAQYNLGVMYQNGLGVEQNYKEALKSYTLSANGGYHEAQYNLSFFYKDGMVVKQDYKKAVELLRLSANQGYEKAQIALDYLCSEKPKVCKL